MSTKIYKSPSSSGYWVNGRYIMLETYEEHKHKFTTQEQKAIEDYIKGLNTIK